MKHLIIGNSTAAIAAIEGIRAVSRTDDITVVASEAHHSYGRPLISYLLGGKIDESKIYYRKADFYEAHRVRLLLGRTAVKLDAPSKLVTLDDGAQIGYDKLLIATGSSPLRFPIAGIEQVQAWSAFTTLDDTRYLDAHVSGDTRVFIIGAGLIGLKCAEGLAERAKSVTVCDLAETILSSILTPKPAKIMQTHLERQGIAFQLGTSVDRFETIDGGYAAIMKNGEIVTFDMLVFAAGVRPNIALVKEAGGAADRGILTNENARTSLPDIYAAGDCTESVDTVTGQRKIMALLPNAYHQGEAAGIHMAGGEHPFTDAIPMNAIGFFGKHILSAGVYTDGEAFESETNGAYRCFYYDERAQRLLGFILIDDAARAGIYTALVREKTQLSKDLFLRLREEPGLIAFSTETRAAVLRNPKKEDTQCK